MRRLLGLLACVVPLAYAQMLQDPTRPPAELGVAQANGIEAMAPAEARAPKLESVLVGRGYAGREVAVIDGKIVRRGEMFNGAVLVRVGPNEAVLKRGGKEEVLRLFSLPIEGKRVQARRGSE
jgi:MSHA biogenesis protein MshK